MKKLFFAVATIATLISCNGGGTNDGGANSVETLSQDSSNICTHTAIIPSVEMLVGKWYVQTLLDSTIEPRDTNCYATFTDSTIGAYAGCNSIGGFISRIGRSVDFLAFENVACTQMECPEMTKEQMMLKAINSVRKFSFPSENELILSNEDDVCVLKLAK